MIEEGDIQKIATKKRAFRTIFKELLNARDVKTLEFIRRRLEKHMDEFSYDLERVIDEDHDIVQDYNSITVRMNERRYKMDEGYEEEHIPEIVEDLKQEVQDILLIIDRVENLIEKKKITHVTKQRKFIKNMGDIIIASVVSAVAYSSPTIALSPASLGLLVVLLVAGSLLIKFANKTDTHSFVESVLISVIICFSVSITVGMFEGEEIIIIMTIAFVSLPSVLIFDAVMK
ncbi:hypothetical protein GF325_15130 [Candidatus Bathyarchaeota archaeon]|nr:hypothetical protein [Candidatus Bathyarchaeota archaeon]